MQPHPRRAERERLLDGAGEQGFAEPASGEWKGEPEIRDLDGPVSVRVELEEAGALAADQAFENANGVAGQMRGEPFLRPGAAIRPVPWLADRLVQPAIASRVD